MVISASGWKPPRHAVFSGVKTRLIAFDLMGVIFTESHIIKNGLFLLLPEPKDYRQVKAVYNLYNLGLITREEFWKKLGCDLEREFLESLKLDPEARDVLSYLKNRYRLAVLSNLPADWARWLLRHHQLEDFFSPIIISGEVRMKKPELGIYSLLKQKSCLPFNQLALVDDKKSCLQPASALGMKTIWVKKEDDKKFEPDFQIDRLSELKRLL